LHHVQLVCSLRSGLTLILCFLLLLGVEGSLCLSFELRLLLHLQGRLVEAWGFFLVGP
jgi:hypothetical protein